MFIAGTHAELIKALDGAYSQLVHLQEGANKGEDPQRMEKDNPDTRQDVEGTMGRSISRGSSSSRRSFSLGFPLPAPIGFFHTEIEVEKPREVSIRRLAYLNKPELLVLLLGSIAAAIHGVIFPIYGLLISTAIKIFYEPQSELKKDSVFWACMYVTLGLVTLAVVPFQNYFFGVAGGKLIQRIRSLCFEKVVNQEIAWFDDPKNSRSVYELMFLQTFFFIWASKVKLFIPFQWCSWCKVID